MPRPLVLLDLGGTLVDRQSAFDHWARHLIVETGGRAEHPAWLLEPSCGGDRSRRELGGLAAGV